jgi:hypothetical protein
MIIKQAAAHWAAVLFIFLLTFSVLLVILIIG